MKRVKGKWRGKERLNNASRAPPGVLRSGEPPSNGCADIIGQAGHRKIYRKRPVFFGQILIDRRQPNLVFMTVHHDMAAREKIWEQFGNSEDRKK